MKSLAILLALTTALGGCVTVAAYRQSKSLMGRPVSEAVARYGPPDTPVTDGARAYVWTRGRVAGRCTLTVRVDGSGAITGASVTAKDFDTCSTLLRPHRARS